MAEPTAGLKASNISCTRGYRELFTGLDLQLDPGQVLRVEGKNGSGKTSLLRILAGLAEPAEGEVLWQGKGIRHPENTYFQDMLYLGHKAGIKFELTPLENLCMARALHGSKEDGGIEEALYQLGLYGFEEITSGNLSAGQKRRVALAELLLTRAKIWILDEPYTSLDVVAIAYLEKLFQQHVQAGGILIITSHQPVTVDGCDCRRIVLPATELEQVA